MGLDVGVAPEATISLFTAFRLQCGLLIQDKKALAELSPTEAQGHRLAYRSLCMQPLGALTGLKGLSSELGMEGSASAQISPNSHN